MNQIPFFSHKDIVSLIRPKKHMLWFLCIDAKFILEKWMG